MLQMRLNYGRTVCLFNSFWWPKCAGLTLWTSADGQVQTSAKPETTRLTGKELIGFTAARTHNKGARAIRFTARQMAALSQHSQSLTLMRSYSQVETANVSHCFRPDEDRMDEDESTG